MIQITFATRVVNFAAIFRSVNRFTFLSLFFVNAVHNVQ